LTFLLDENIFSFFDFAETPSGVMISRQRALLQIR
jgi:hypothetical protein